MNVGEYVRTKDGGIGKIIKCPFKSMYLDEIWGDIENTGTIITDNVYKSSPNIIDLIEPQDLLYIDIDDSYEGGIIVPRIPETQAELNKMIELIKNNTWILKGIVTHEQLEEMEYKI